MLSKRGPLSKIVGNGIGLAQEYKADRNKRKEEESSHPSSANYPEHHDDDSEDEEIDDELWAQDLDAAQLEMTESNSSTLQIEFDENTWMSNFLQRNPPPPYLQQQPRGPLSMPVIIPERRPGFKTRGFVRAYAPVLEDAGIDQNAWMDFLLGFEKSIAQHKYFHVANVAVWVADKVREGVLGYSWIVQLVTLTMHLSIEAARRGYMNVQGNRFLDRMNEEYFKPRGTYAMIIKYSPKSDEVEETVDVTSNITQQVAKRDEEDRSKWKNLIHGSAGKVQHEAEIPEFAPLVFPKLDNLDDKQKENAVKHFGHFMGDYYDRRGQAKFDAENADSKLAGVTGEKEFASRYSDPNHPASQGGLVSTLTGGNVQYKGPVQKLTDRRNERRSKLGISRQAGKAARKQRKNQRPLKKVLRQDVLYLMVVNMPTDEEMDAALTVLETAKTSSGDKAPTFDVNYVRKTLGLQGLGRRQH